MTKSSSALEITTLETKSMESWNTLALERQGLALCQDQLSHDLAQQAERMKKILSVKIRTVIQFKTLNLNCTLDTFCHLGPDHQNREAAAAETAGSHLIFSSMRNASFCIWCHLVTIFKAPLGGNDPNVPEFFEESSRHVHPEDGIVKDQGFLMG